ncbi:unnamed protein product [Fraxinus pennsylvanica]|uniref:Uncharacterized protein n=1 Tax=Fraxinus pennsylvanica TaxID=56036 RepID=A0AAD2A704_9LAMI|nr:unnamed protein product [Fraxinus pennsylvanica]
MPSKKFWNLMDLNSGRVPCQWKRLSQEVIVLVVAEVEGVVTGTVGVVLEADVKVAAVVVVTLEVAIEEVVVALEVEEEDVELLGSQWEARHVCCWCREVDHIW